MDAYTEKRMKEIKKQIQNSTLEELLNTQILEEEKAIEAGNTRERIFYAPNKYLHDLRLTLNETIQRRKSKEEIEKKQRKTKDDEAMELGSSNYRRKDHNFATFEETDEERLRRIKARNQLNRTIKNIRKKRDEKEKIKSAPRKTKNNNRFNKSKNKTGKKIRNIFLALAVSGIAITGVAQGISTAHANSREYDYIASTVENLDENQIAQKAENILKEEISKATGENIENISFSDSWRDSSSHIAKIKAGNQEFRYLDDLRGGDVFGENTMSNNIFKLVLEMNNAKGKDRKEVIEALRKSMNFSKNKNIRIENGKLVEIEDSTKDSVDNNKVENTKDGVEKDGDER